MAPCGTPPARGGFGGLACGVSVLRQARLGRQCHGRGGEAGEAPPRVGFDSAGKPRRMKKNETYGYGRTKLRSLLTQPILAAT